ncbi:MAG: UDP-2,3-diacylglucosamine diphosphatase LpxI [Rickettsiales bacterium]|jgi:DUF1009 family protein|nr:UDP-2,3-diacylglucosamine diphosphatase LpxI [Rickettsiales bacterium]
MKKTSDKKVALFCGAYKLPMLTRDALRAAGFEVFVVGLRGFYDPALKPDMEIRLGGGGAAARECKKRGIKQLCFVGHIGNVNWSDIRPDIWSLGILAHVLKNQHGNDSMINVFIDGLEKKGFTVVAAQDLAPDLVFGAGIHTKTKPTRADMADIERAIVVSRAIGAEDIGQSVVVEKIVLAIEAAEGTAGMLKRVAEIRQGRKQGGVFAKMAKPKQDMRIDLPAIGMTTLTDCIAAKLRGIVLEADKCFAIDRAELIALADKHKIFIVAK